MSGYSRSNGLMNSDELGAIWKSTFDLDFSDHFCNSLHDVANTENLRPERHEFSDCPAIPDFFEKFRSYQCHRFRIVELQSPVLSLAGEFAGGEDHQFLQLTWGQMHREILLQQKETSRSDKSR